MKIGVYYVESNNVNSNDLNKENKDLINRLITLSHTQMELCSLDEVNKYDLVLSFIGGGGTEGRFLQVMDKLPEPIFLLTTGANNSLAASMEILSYLNHHEILGEIIHGTDEYMAERIQILAKVFAAKKKLNNFKVARVGKPSDWLIASEVDALESKQRNGIEIIDVAMEELFCEIDKKQYPENEYTKRFMNMSFNENEKIKALYIYGALRRIVDKYNLNGLTIRCFDLLKPVNSTGCAALAILNAEGIYAACEGDVPSLLSMALLGELTGEPCFQANPSRIDTSNNEIIFAHCTLPLTMFEKGTLMSHYESDLGVAFRGEIVKGPVTVFKTDGMIDEYFVSSGMLIENLNELNLCRTQIKLKLDKPVEYFLTESIGNHHIIIKGDYTKLINEFYKWF